MTFDMLGEVNLLAALAAAAAYFAFGALWYTVLFGPAWQRASGVSREQTQGASMAVPFIGSFIAYFVGAVVLSALAGATDSSTIAEGLVLGILVGVGFLAASIWVNSAYEMRPQALFWINAANAVIGYTIMAVIVTIWR